MSDLVVVTQDRKRQSDSPESSIAALNRGVATPGDQGDRGPHGGLSGYGTHTVYDPEISGYKARATAIEAQRGVWTPIPLSGNWQSYIPEVYAVPSYRKIDDIVFLNGVVSTVAFYSGLISTLPVGFRPTQSILWPVMTGLPAAPGRVQIESWGGLLFVAGNTNFVSLCGLMYGL